MLKDHKEFTTNKRKIHSETNKPWRLSILSIAFKKLSLNKLDKRKRLIRKLKKLTKKSPNNGSELLKKTLLLGTRRMMTTYITDLFNIYNM